MTPFKRSSEIQAIDPDLALKAARQMVGIAERHGTKAAIAGGLAMQIFGFTRATKDVDIVASAKLDLKSEESLQFGGNIYHVQVEGKSVEVDWIVRSDDKKMVYHAALESAEMTEHGFPIITPEWMVILKYLAGRGKDHTDLIWLLSEQGLVDRNAVFGHVEKLMGPMAFWAKQDMGSAFAEADFLKEKE